MHKRTAPLSAAAASPGDAYNMAFSGTEVVAGRGQGVVVATAMETELGRIAHLIESAEQKLTPLQERLGRLGKTLVAACLVICSLVTILGVIRANRSTPCSWPGQPGRGGHSGAGCRPS